MVKLRPFCIQVGRARAPREIDGMELRGFEPVSRHLW